MHNLWLKFLTEIDENTTDAAPELIANKDTAEALEILQTSAYSDAEMISYQQYWLDVSTEKSALERERKEGREEGRAEGEKAKAIAIARNAKQMGFGVEQISLLTGLGPDEIAAL